MQSHRSPESQKALITLAISTGMMIVLLYKDDTPTGIMYVAWLVGIMLSAALIGQSVLSLIAHCRVHRYIMSPYTATIYEEVLTHLDSLNMQYASSRKDHSICFDMGYDDMTLTISRCRRYYFCVIDKYERVVDGARAPEETHVEEGWEYIIPVSPIHGVAKMRYTKEVYCERQETTNSDTASMGMQMILRVVPLLREMTAHELWDLHVDIVNVTR